MQHVKSIYWHQGLFLKPHHFQYLYAQQAHEIFKLKASLSPFFWGVRMLNIDKKALLNKSVSIDALEIVFLDGSRVAVGENAILPARSFEEKYDEIENGMTLYVGIKTFDTNIANVTELDSYGALENVTTRFVTHREASDVANLYHKDASAQIQFMDYVLKLFFEDEIENLHGYQTIPVARLKKENEQIVLSDNFVPPLLEVKADPNLYATVKTIQTDLTSHLLQLQEYKLPSHIVLQEPNYLTYVMALQALSSYVPKLENMIRVSKHPFDFYELFLELVGILSTFSNRVTIFGKLENGKSLISEYDHLNLYDCFDAIQQLIKELLDAIIVGPDYILPFVKNDTTFTLDCPLSIFHGHYRYFLLLKTPTEQETLSTYFVEFAKIAAYSEIETIVERSLLGLPFEPYDMPLQGMPQGEENSYFELVTKDIQWEHIQQMQNITIVFDEALEDVSIELVVLKN